MGDTRQDILDAVARAVRRPRLRQDLAPRDRRAGRGHQGGAVLPLPLEGGDPRRPVRAGGGHPGTAARRAAGATSCSIRRRGWRPRADPRRHPRAPAALRPHRAQWPHPAGARPRGRPSPRRHLELHRRTEAFFADDADRLSRMRVRLACAFGSVIGVIEVGGTSSSAESPTTSCGRWCSASSATSSSPVRTAPVIRVRAPPGRPVASAPVHADRLARVRAAMAEQRVDACLLSVGPDLPWLIGYEAMPLERLTMLVVPRDGVATLVIPQLEVPRVDAGRPRLPDPLLGRDRGSRRHRRRAARPPATAAIGNRTWAQFLVALQRARPATTFTTSSDIVGPLREVKDPHRGRGAAPGGGGGRPDRGRAAGRAPSRSSGAPRPRSRPTSGGESSPRATSG